MTRPPGPARPGTMGPSPAPTRVVYVVRRYPQLSQTFIRNEIQGLRASGVDVRVYSLQTPDTAHVDPDWAGTWQVLRRPELLDSARALAWWACRRPGRLLRMISRAVRLRERDCVRALLSVAHLAREVADADVRACHTHFCWETVPYVALLCALVNAPSSVTVHAADLYLPVPATGRRLKVVDQIVTVCQYNVDYLAAHQMTRRPVTVVPCGVEPPRTAPGPPADPHHVVCVARLVPKKGVDVLLRAMALVSASRPQTRLDIIGDGPLREELEALTAELGLAAAVQFLGPRSNAESLATIEGATVFALASRVPPDGDTDALPVVLREAMIRGRPVVTTAVAGIPELVDESTGWLVPPDDPAAFADGLLTALNDPEESTRRGNAAAVRVRAGGTIEATNRGMRRVFGLDEP